MESTPPAARLGYLELGARLQREIGLQAEAGASATVIVVGTRAEAIEAYRRRAAAAFTATPTPDDEAPEAPSFPF